MTKALYADLGKLSFEEFSAVRNEISSLRKEGNLPDIILFAEHDPSLLFGRKTTSFSHSAIAAAQAARRHPFDHAKDQGVSVHHTDYSGATYSGPGQMVVCSIGDYTRLVRSNDSWGYNTLLDRMIIHALESLNIKPELKTHVMADINGISHRIASRVSNVGPKFASGTIHFHVSEEGIRHFGMLSHPDHDNLFTSMEGILGFEPTREEVTKAVLRSAEKNMKYDKIEKCTISRNEHGLVVRKD